MNKLFLLIALFATTACGTMQKSTTEPDKNEDVEPSITFNTASLTLKQLNQADAEYANGQYDISLQIDIEKGSYNGKSGCNNYFGTVEKVGDHALKFGMAGVTEMMCAEDVMQWEARYLNALTEKQFDVLESGDVIELKDSENNVSLTFSKAQP